MIVLPSTSLAVALIVAVPAVPIGSAVGETDRASVAMTPFTTTPTVNGVPETIVCVAVPPPKMFPPPFAAS
jgi:hypothetical protein